jgi:hypothetical protein
MQFIAQHSSAIVVCRDARFKSETDDIGKVRLTVKKCIERGLAFVDPNDQVILL